MSTDRDIFESVLGPNFANPSNVLCRCAKHVINQNIKYIVVARINIYETEETCFYHADVKIHALSDELNMFLSKIFDFAKILFCIDLKTVLKSWTIY